MASSAGTDFRYTVPDHNSAGDQSLLTILSDQDGVLVQIDYPAVCATPPKTVTVSRSAPHTEVICVSRQQCTGHAVNRSGRVQALSTSNPVLHVFLKPAHPFDQSDDAMMLLPTNRYGSMYRVAAYADIHQPRWTAIAHEAGTVLQYTDCNGVAVASPVLAIGDTFQLECGSLAPVCPVQPNRQLAGDAVQSQDGKKFALISGAFCAQVPPSEPSCDQLNEMLWPFSPDDARYSDYILTEFNRAMDTLGPGDRFRIIAVDPGVVVTISAVLPLGDTTFAKPCILPTHTFTGPGDFCDVHIDSGGRVIDAAGKKFLVVQYMEGQTVSGVGDPAMLLQVPTLRFLCEYRFFSWEGFNGDLTLSPPNLNGSFVNLVIPTANVLTTELDGLPLAAACQEALTPIAIPGTSYSWVECRLPNPPPGAPLFGQQHVVRGLDGSGNPIPIGAYAYGQVHAGAYAYPAGLSFELQ